jgi:hypothetical protein
LAATALCAAAIAGPPPPAPATTRPSSAPHESQPQGVPDDEFIEFLGTDDVGDETWWEFLKKAPPRRDNPHAPPPQEANQ